MTENDVVTLNRGLTGVYFDRTQTTFIDGKEGVLEYRGYSIDDLAEKSTFEETAFLLLHGCLPNRIELERFDLRLKESRAIPDEVMSVIRAVQKAHPMSVLRTGVSALSAVDPEANDNSIEATVRKGERLTAQVPTIVMAHNAMRHGRDPIPPNSELGHAANFLYMLNGEHPREDTARLIDRDFVLHADHGSNASAFAARIAAGTEADLHAAVTAGIAVLAGPRHGGAAENVLLMAQEIGEPENAVPYVKRLRDNRQPVMGFGHRVYKVEDPRAKHLREGIRQLGEEKGQPKWFAIMQAVVDAMQPLARRGLNVNVDFFAGVIYHLLGIPTDLFVPIFAAGRIPGWSAQVVEQFENNILLRPLLHYTGPRNQNYVSIDKR